MTTSKQKAQGSREELWQRRKLLASGFGVEDIHRGPQGDVAIRTVDHGRIVIEVKDSANLSAHAVLLRAIDKARRHGHQGIVWLTWQRMVRKPGAKRRTPLGPRIAVMLEDDAIRMAGGNPDAPILEAPYAEEG
jgi:hypothetical protein